MNAFLLFVETPKGKGVCSLLACGRAAAEPWRWGPDGQQRPGKGTRAQDSGSSGLPGSCRLPHDPCCPTPWPCAAGHCSEDPPAKPSQGWPRTDQAGPPSQPHLHHGACFCLEVLCGGKVVPVCHHVPAGQSAPPECVGSLPGAVPLSQGQSHQRRNQDPQRRHFPLCLQTAHV